MTATHGLGIIGCGDFLRWMTPGLRASQHIQVRALFDPVQERAAKYAQELGGKAVTSSDAVIEDKSIDTVCLFVPPWLRKELLLRALAAGKHVLATKPLSATAEDAEVIVQAALRSNTRCAVLYGRSGDAMVELTRQVLTSGEIGKLALYKQDWLHHYPQWNTWALDPQKNGGPFMDAMIHNLNAARYLMGRPVVSATFFSDRLAHPDLRCADTESLKVDFAGRGTAYLFITWAADLAVHSTAGNDREHIDLYYLVTDHGWRLTREQHEGQLALVGSREGKKRYWYAPPLGGSVFDRFARWIDQETAMPSDLVSPQMAADDIRLLRTLEKRVGQHMIFELPVR